MKLILLSCEVYVWDRHNIHFDDIDYVAWSRGDFTRDGGEGGDGVLKIFFVSQP